MTEGTQPQPIRRRHFFAMALLLLLVIFPVAEMSMRVKAKELIDQEREKLQQILTKVSLGIPKQSNPANDPQIIQMQTDLARFDNQLIRLEKLIIAGSNNASETARQIMRNTTDVSLRRVEDEIKSTVGAADLIAKSAALGSEKELLERALKLINDKIVEIDGEINSFENALSVLQQDALPITEDQNSITNEYSKLWDKIQSFYIEWPVSSEQSSTARIANELDAQLIDFVAQNEPKTTTPGESREAISLQKANEFVRGLKQLLKKINETQDKLKERSSILVDQQNASRELEIFYKTQNTNGIRETSAAASMFGTDCKMSSRLTRWYNLIQVGEKNESNPSATRCPVLPFALSSSDLLKAISIIASGALGSFFMTFRLRKFHDVNERSVMGILAGFVALLFIEGGKVLFLVEMSPGVQHNPFSGAFIGFLAGLFTEKGFTIPEDMVNNVTNNGEQDHQITADGGGQNLGTNLNPQLTDSRQPTQV